MIEEIDLTGLEAERETEVGKRSVAERKGHLRSGARAAGAGEVAAAGGAGARAAGDDAPHRERRMVAGDHGAGVGSCIERK